MSIAWRQLQVPSPPVVDRSLLMLTLALVGIGFVGMTSAAIEHAAGHYGDAFFFSKRHLLHLVLSLGVIALIYRMPLETWERSGWLLLLLGFVMLALVLIPGIGREVNGSRRWLMLGPLNLQVSEFVKLFVVVYLAGYLVRRQQEIRQRWSGFAKPMALVFGVTLLLMLQPDFGATVVTAGAAFALLFLAGAKLGQFVLIILGSLAALATLVVIEPYRMKRFTAFTDPWADQFNTGYQLTQSLIAFGRGEWTGVGLGNSIQKLFYLPEAHTDFVFAIWAEEFGLLGSTLLLGLFALLIARVVQIARRADCAGWGFAAYLGYGVAIIFSMHVFISVGVNTGLLPTKGLALPFVSYGGSSLMVSLIMLTLVARIDRELRSAGGARHE